MMSRLILIVIPCTLVTAGLMYAMAAFNGLDPLAPEVRTIAWVSLLVAAYVGFRLAMVINRYLKKREGGETASPDGGASAAKAGAAFKSWGRSSSLDARMAERRRRVEAARAKQAESESE